MTEQQPTTVTLSARVGKPLADEGVRSMVEGAAAAIAERIGVPLVGLETTKTSVTATLLGPQLVAVGFAAELRRVTNHWHRAKYGTDLWTRPPSEETETDAPPWGDDPDWWKEA